MSQPDDIGSFVRENKDIIREYLETRYEIIRLKGIRSISKIAGSLIWIAISLLLGLLVLIFGGLTMGYWLSGLFDSYVLGFGLTTLVFVLFMVLLTVFRRQLFIDPVIRVIIKETTDEQ